MDGGPVQPHTRGQRTPMRIQPRESRQQRGVDVQQAAAIARHEAGRQHAHEAGQHDQRRLMRVDCLRQRGFEGLARIELRVRHHRRRHAVGARDLQAPRFAPVAHDGCRLDPVGVPALVPSRPQDRLQVAAAPGDQADD